jgi:4-carboxymuconolactone decarboxylase
MTDDIPDPYDRGLNVLRDVYAGDVVTLPEGTMAFNDVMVQTLFDQVWRREVLDVRSRRLLLMGVIQTSCGRRSSCSLRMRDTRTSLVWSCHARR